jgi:hypothetical protein
LSRAAEAAEESPRTTDAKHQQHQQAKAESPKSCPPFDNFRFFANYFLKN